MTYQYKFVPVKLDKLTYQPDPCVLSVLGSQGWYLSHILACDGGMFYIMVLPKE
jgi:hypothetical protein